MTTELVLTLVAALVGSGGVAGVITIIFNRRKVQAETNQIVAETDLAYAREFRTDLDSAKARIAELERDMLNMHREMKELTRENIELRKKVARLETENQRLEGLLAAME